MKVNFVDLGRQYEELKEEIDKGIKDVCERTSFILGPQVKDFEDAFSDYLETKHCIGVASGTDALILTFEALVIERGDEIIMPVNTFAATAMAAVRAGAVPVFVDMEQDTYLMDLNLAEKAVTHKTKAICPVHLYGRACNMDEYRDFASKHSLEIIEDAAQAHGARWNGKRVGTFGRCGCFSFYPGKNLGAFGDAGAVVTEDDALAERLRALRNYGSPRKYHHPMLGTNSRLDSIQAVVLNAKLKRLDDWNLKRWKAAERYNQMLEDLKDYVKTPKLCTPDEHVFHLYVVELDRRDTVLESLKEKGVFAGIHYPEPLHQLGAFKSFVRHDTAFPVAEASAKRILSLPMFPHITPKEQEWVVENLHSVLVR